eukprot:COSAG01_NODE_5365_length_4308_cov_1.852697_2_plen_92_part_00
MRASLTCVLPHTECRPTDRCRTCESRQAQAVAVVRAVVEAAAAAAAAAAAVQVVVELELVAVAGLALACTPACATSATVLGGFCRQGGRSQ